METTTWALIIAAVTAGAGWAAWWLQKRQLRLLTQQQVQVTEDERVKRLVGTLLLDHMRSIYEIRDEARQSLERAQASAAKTGQISLEAEQRLTPLVDEAGRIMNELESTLEQASALRHQIVSETETVKVAVDSLVDIVGDYLLRDDIEFDNLRGAYDFTRDRRNRLPPNSPERADVDRILEHLSQQMREQGARRGRREQHFRRLRQVRDERESRSEDPPAIPADSEVS